MNSIRNMKTLGQNQAVSFIENRLIKRVIALDEVLKRNKILLFSRPVAKILSHSQNKITSLKIDRALFQRLYINCQVRDGNFEDFFKHENQPYPPALSDDGSLRFGKKSDLIDCLDSLLQKESPEIFIDPYIDMIIIDGPAVVHFITPQHGDTFSSYGMKFAVYIQNQITPVTRRIDVIFDDYRSDSLKSTLRQKRGQAGRIRVEEKRSVPKNWSEFLKNDENKKELFSFLSQFLNRQEYAVKVVTSYNEKVLCTQPANLQALMPCSHEEADTRMILHAANGASEGCMKILIRTVDTDVVVLAVHFVSRIPCERLLVAFGVGKSFRFLDIKAYAEQLGPEKCAGILAFHALTGCDTTSSFKGKGKRSGWAAWNHHPTLNTTLASLSTIPTLIQVTEAMPNIEKFVAVLYDRCSGQDTVNGVRQHLVTHKGTDMENIPPTQDALLQHVLRAAYQAGHIWHQSLVANPMLPDIADYGWIKPIPPSTTWKVSFSIYSCSTRTIVFIIFFTDQMDNSAGRGDSLQKPYYMQL